MPKLYFYYSAMNAGKTTTLLQSSFNYKERGLDTILFTPRFTASRQHFPDAPLNSKDGVDKDLHHDSNVYISSRIGLKAPAIGFDQDFLFFDYIHTLLSQPSPCKISCILVDEAQFLTESQVLDLTRIVDFLKLPVLAYGLRTDFQGKCFPGSQALLGLCDVLCEIKTMCHCGSKATMNLRIQKLKDKVVVVRQGEQVLIGGEDCYVSVCRKHFMLGEPFTQC